MMYVVMRSVSDECGNRLEPLAIIWRGEDPRQFQGGTGSWRERGRFLTREFYCLRNGRWHMCRDPRPLDAQILAVLSDIGQLDTDEYALLATLFEEDANADTGDTEDSGTR